MLELFKPRSVFLQMNKILILLLCVFCSSGSYGQVKTVFFDVKEQVTTDSTKANSYAIYGRVTGENLWVFKKYDLNDYLTVSGAFKDEALQIPHGKFVYYDWINPYDGFINQETVAKGKERYIKLSGNFEDGLRQGQWLSYYVNGQVKSVVNYEKGMAHGEFKSFNTKGDLEESGKFVNDLKEGEWLLKGGLTVVTFKNDKIISTVNKTRRQLKKEQENKGKL